MKFLPSMIIFTVELLYLLHVNGHLLPEDSQTDSEELLNREKRDDFLNDILKTIPFFNVQPSQSSLNDDDDPNGISDEEDDQLFPTSSTVALKTVNLTASLHVPSSSYILSSSLAPSPSTIIKTAAITNTTSKLPTLTLTKIFLSSTFTYPYSSSPVLKRSSVIQTSSMTHIKSASITATKSTKVLPSSKITLYVSSRVTLMPHSSSDLAPSSAKIPFVTASVHDDMPIIQMMILSTEDRLKNGPKLPDETGYGEKIGEETEFRSIRYLYTNVLIPVMSGLCGALLITFGIIIYRCVRRRKLQKVKYYGGKPNSAVYRLDQSMSLLAELTSDEED